MKITFAMIVFNTDFVLKQVLESIIPYAHKIIIVEGPVKYWQDKGFTTSTDNTNYILNEFDVYSKITNEFDNKSPHQKVKIIHGQWKEKTEQCQAFMKYVPEDTDYLWCIDADEVFKPETIEEVFKVLKHVRPGSVGFRSYTFYGGFQRVMGGMETRHNFKRVLQYAPGCKYLNHRPPTLSSETGKPFKHMEGMYHYSYVSPNQVKAKIEYYEEAVIKNGDCKPDYYNKVFLPWQKDYKKTESLYNGVHEFKSAACYTNHFDGHHPQIIRNSMEELQDKFKRQLDEEKDIL